MIDPKLVKELLKNPDVIALVDHFKEEAVKLNRLDDIRLTDPVEYTIECKARQKAFQTIQDILDPLVSLEGFELNNFDKKEFIT